MKHDTETMKRVSESLKIIKNLESEMIKGNTKITMFELMNETRYLLNITKPLEKYPNFNTNQNLF